MYLVFSDTLSSVLILTNTLMKPAQVNCSILLLVPTALIFISYLLRPHLCPPVKVTPQQTSRTAMSWACQAIEHVDNYE